MARLCCERNEEMVSSHLWALPDNRIAQKATKRVTTIVVTMLYL